MPVLVEVVDMVAVLVVKVVVVAVAVLQQMHKNHQAGCRPIMCCFGSTIFCAQQLGCWARPFNADP